MMAALATSYSEQRYYPQQPRDYQEKAIEAILTSWRGEESQSRPLLSAATGAGKTTIIAEVLRRYVNPATMRALVIAHREELIEQLYERIANQFDGALDRLYAGGSGMFGAPGLGVVMAERDDANARILCGTVQSLHPRRLQRVLKHGAFDVLVVDEAHHFAAGGIYDTLAQALLQANPNLKILGVSATPYRNDKKALGALFTHIPFEWTIEDGIASGYLVPPTRIKVTTSVDLSTVRTQAGDYNQSRMLSILKAQNWLELCVNAFKEHVLPIGRQTAAFLPSVEMSIAFADALNKEQISAAHIDGETPKKARREIIQAFRAGEIFAVSNVGVVTEGFDVPSIGTIFLARPTRSKNLFTQILGRGLRPSIGKDHCVVVDLSVHDTRALTIGSLLGKMVVCYECSAEFYFGAKQCPSCGVLTGRTISCHKCKTVYSAAAKACPTCGTVEPQYVMAQDRSGATSTDSFKGSALVAVQSAIFQDAYAAWHTDARGFSSCSVGDEGILMIVPPTVDDYYRLCLIPKGQGKPITTLRRNGDISSLLLDADREVKVRAEQLGNKEAEWRKRPPSPKQVEYLRNLGGSVPSGATMGDVSNMIAHIQGVKRIKSLKITPAVSLVDAPPAPKPAPVPPPPPPAPKPIAPPAPPPAPAPVPEPPLKPAGDEIPVTKEGVRQLSIWD